MTQISRAEITMLKFYAHSNFNQLWKLLILLKIFSFNMHASSQMRVPEDFFIFRDSTFTRWARNTVWFLEQATPEFISPHQTAQTSVWWHTLSVASSIACLPLACSICRWNEKASAGRSVWHETYCWQCSNNEWCISQGSVATQSRNFAEFCTGFYPLSRGEIILKIC